MRWIGQITYDEVAYFREDVIIEAGNKLGIGTTSPEKTLDVFTTTTNDGIRLSTTGASGDLDVVRIENGNSTTFPVGKLYMYYGTSAHATISALSNSMKLAGGTNTSGHIDFFSGSNEKMRLTNTGLGIGTTSPGVPLEVQGSVKFGTAATGISHHIEGTDEYRVEGIDVDGNGWNSLHFKADGNDGLFLQKDTNNVGIGTTSPSELLNISSGAATHAKILIDAGADADLILDKGAGSRRSHIDYKVAGTTKWYAGTADSDVVGDGDDYFVGTTVGGSNAEFFLKRSNGNVGIGTTSPLAKLDVRGSTTGSSASGLIVKNSAGNMTLGVRDDGVVQVPTGYFWAQHANGMYSTGSIKARGGITNDSGTLGMGGSGNLDTVNITSAGNVGIGITAPTQALHLPDSKQIALGTGADLKIQHNGTNSEIGNSTGQLNIYNHADNSDINFMADDQSGGIETYFFLDGSTGYTSFPDGKILGFGAGGDLTLQHDGNNSYINANGTGNLIIKQMTDDKDIVFQCDDGSGGTTAYLTLDGSTSRIEVTKNMRFADSVSLLLGGSSDLQLLHDGSNSYINAGGVGDLYIKQNNNDKDIIFQSDDGSGGTTEYFRLNGGSSSPYTVFPDNSRLAFGAGFDLRLNHDGSSSYIENYTGNLLIRNNQDDGDIILQSDDGSGGTTAYLTLDGGLGYTTVQKRMRFDDAVELQLGASGDLTIKHDGSHNYILGSTGNLHLQSQAVNTDVIFETDDGAGGNAVYFRLDGSQAVHDGSATTALYTNWPDNSRISLGTGHDLQFKHTGSFSSILNQVGDLYILNSADNKDIIFQCDDGSGGATAYLTLDGGLGYTTVQKNMQFGDEVSLTVGSSNDFVILHDSSDTTLQNLTGNLTISNATDDGDIVFQSDDGSGGVETYFFLDGSANGANPATVFPDNSSLIFGTGNDLYLRHTGTNSEIKNYVGDLIIANNANDKDIIFQSDDGSGGVATYFSLDGSASQTVFSKHAQFIDGQGILLGSGSADLQLIHDGSNSYISNNTGHLYIDNNLDDGDVIFRCDDGSGGLAAYLTLDGGIGYTTVQKRMRFDDNTQLQFGNGGDLQFYHTGGIGILYNNTGDFRFRQNTNDGNIAFECDDGSGGVTPYITLDGGDATIVVAKPLLINGAAIQASPNLYGSTIKLLPSDFAANDDGGNTKFGVGYVDHAGETTYGMRAANSETELYAFVSIPEGMKATHVDIFDRNSVGVIVYEAQINATTMVSKGTGNANTTIDITDVNATATNFLAIQVTTIHATNSLVHGGSVTIAAQ